MNSLIFLSSIASSEIASSIDSSTPTVAPKVYSTFEMVFWYVALLVVVVLFIVYLKANSKKTKKISSLISKIDQDINRYKVVLNKRKNKPTKKTMVDVFAKTSFLLSLIESTIAEVKEKTQLADCDNILSNTNELSQKIKKYQFDKNDGQLSNNINEVQNDLLKLKGQLELIKSFVK